MNELFSFREELTEKEIGQFVNELSEVSLDSFIKAFEMGKNKIKEIRFYVKSNIKNSITNFFYSKK